MVVDWMSTELLINGIWQSGTIQCPKIATPVMKGGIALFFSLSVIERYGTEMKKLEKCKCLKFSNRFYKIKNLQF